MCVCVYGRGGGVTVVVSKKSVLLNFAIHHLCRQRVDVVNFGPRSVSWKTGSETCTTTLHFDNSLGHGD